MMKELIEHYLPFSLAISEIVDLRELRHAVNS